MHTLDDDHRSLIRYSRRPHSCIADHETLWPSERRRSVGSGSVVDILTTKDCQMGFVATQGVTKLTTKSFSIICQSLDLDLCNGELGL